MSNSVASIDLRYRDQNAGLFARLVWQVLFEVYRGGTGDLSRMDSMLCDLKMLERRFEDRKNFTLYWRHNEDFTDLIDYREWNYHQLEITYNHVNRTVEITGHPAKTI